MMGRQRPDYNPSWADKDPIINHEGQTKTQLILMMGRQRPVYNPSWADKEPFITHDGQTKTRL